MVGSGAAWSRFEPEPDPEPEVSFFIFAISSRDEVFIVGLFKAGHGQCAQHIY